MYQDLIYSRLNPCCQPLFVPTYRKFKQPFFLIELYRQPGELSIVFGCATRK